MHAKMYTIGGDNLKLGKLCCFSQLITDGHMLLDLDIYYSPITDADCLVNFDDNLVVLLMANSQ
jgi:hypothetical protein